MRQPHAPSRTSSRPAWLSASLATLALCLGAPPAVQAFVAPTTPTFVLAWGNTGSAPGQFSSPFFVATDASGNVYVPDSGNNRVQKFNSRGDCIRVWGTAGTGDGQFNAPTAVAIDAAGNVYITDYSNDRVQKFDSNGNYLLQWGTTGAGNGQFSGTEGIAIDASGNVYVGDYGNNRIEVFTGSGAYLRQWGTIGSGNGQFNGPEGIAIDYAGNVLVVDPFNNRVEQFSTTGTYLGQFGGVGTGDGQFSFPGGIAVDAIGNIYVADAFANRVQKFGRTGAYLAQWGSTGSGNGQFSGLFGVSVDGSGNVYTTEYNNNRIQKFSGAGASLPISSATYLFAWGSQGTGAGMFNSPFGCATDAAGNLYVVDDTRVEKFSPDGTFLVQFGSAQLVSGRSIALDASGNAYVTDIGAQGVVKFAPSGTFLTFWGGAGSGNGQFQNPSGIAVDAANNVYVVDSSNNRVQKFGSTGTYLAQWGSFGVGNGQFRSPSGIAMDPVGNVYVGDGLNGRIEKFSSAGAYLGQWDAALGILAVDGLGNVFAQKTQLANVIQAFTSNGVPLVSWGSTGSGPGQFSFITGMAADPAGNLYVVDRSNYRVEKFATSALITFVSDVGNDQGHRARLRFRHDSADAPGSGATVLGYDVFLRAEAPAPETAMERWGVPAQAQSTFMVPATGAATYTVDVSTGENATPSLPWYSAYFVRTYTPSGYRDSDFGYGYSVDNLSPPVPSPFTAGYASGSTHLHWGPSPASDFSTFKLYRGADAAFVPAPGNLVAATADTGFADGAPVGSWYKLSAVDLSGNESAYAVLAPTQVTSVGAGPALEFSLEGVRPNPATTTALVVRFTLPVPAPAKLDLIDVAGRVVASRQVGTLGVGRHALNIAASRHVAAGLYFLRLTQGPETRSVRVTVLE